MGKIKINLNAIKLNTSQKPEKVNYVTEAKEVINEPAIEVDTSKTETNNESTTKENNENKEKNNTGHKNNIKIDLKSIKANDTGEKKEEVKGMATPEVPAPDKIDNKKSSEKKDIPTHSKVTETKQDTKKNESNIKINKKSEEKSLFKNYESVFKKDKKIILKHIKKLKEMPKTNIVLLSALTAITIAGIGFLFYINPETHNLNNYKNSIIDTYIAVSGQKSGSGDLDDVSEKVQINKGGYIYDVEIKNINGEKTYIYNEKYFTKKGDLDKYIDKEIKEKKKIKIVKILKNSFSK